MNALGERVRQKSCLTCVEIQFRSQNYELSLFIKEMANDLVPSNCCKFGIVSSTSFGPTTLYLGDLLPYQEVYPQSAPPPSDPAVLTPALFDNPPQGRHGCSAAADDGPHALMLQGSDPAC